MAVMSDKNEKTAAEKTLRLQTAANKKRATAKAIVQMHLGVAS